MVKAIRVHDVGGAEVLKWEDVEVGEPKEGEIRVKHKAIGVNFIDVYFLQGSFLALYPRYGGCGRGGSCWTWTDWQESWLLMRVTRWVRMSKREFSRPIKLFPFPPQWTR